MPHLTYIDTLSDEGGVSNDEGVYTFSMSAFKERRNHGLLDLTFGFLQLNITDPKMIGLPESP